ncbi:MAG: putative mannose-sensitive agglutinin (MSHA) biogenesis protein MshD (Pilus type IV) [Candidatus Gallionella acididurans]|uniref:Putative mannose-sensitive agglutinin (MSHA) biogenesis protein MshD (Pilus type IV) n=1 Tax=Candidatus Gallionella acididurans TaxID=1796491 RepID=A0A139BTR1_9PROT|nr:MAG: putative mannose-sensitive agglutinin (MSHA) biogenesis protein MshD (Pilus type IV) [Candidatus Gallionella acididurans]
MNKAEHNFRLLQEIEENRRFLLQVYVQNPELLKTADARIRPLLAPLPIGKSAASTTQRGISLIELIMFIMIVSVALAGILLVMNVTEKSSADPLVHKQALAIAESLLEEVELMPFTYCDPDDPTAASAVSATLGAQGCTAQIENMGPEAAYAYQPAAETRTSLATPFDNVNDYAGFNMNAGNGGIMNITGTVIPALSGYSASVAEVPLVFSGIAGSDANAAPQVLQITVTVSGPDGVPVVLDGIRTRYAPTAVP